MTARLWSIVLIACVVPAAEAIAQVPTTAEPLTPRPFLIRRAPGDLDRLTALHEAGDWAGIERPTSAAARALDLERLHAAVMWIAADRLGRRRVLRVVVSAGPRRPFDPDLPGVGGTDASPLTEVFLSRSAYGRSSSPVATRKKRSR